MVVLYKVALYNKLRDSLARDMQRFDSRNFLANSDSSQSLEDGWRANDEKSQGLSRASHFSNDKFKSRLLSQGGIDIATVMIITGVMRGLAIQ